MEFLSIKSRQRALVPGCDLIRALIHALIWRKAKMPTGTFFITLNASSQYSGFAPVKNLSNSPETSMLTGSESKQRWLDQCIVHVLYWRPSEIFRCTRSSKSRTSALNRHEVSNSQMLNFNYFVIITRQQSPSSAFACFRSTRYSGGHVGPVRNSRTDK